MLRPFDPSRDREASHRIWREVGWHASDDYATMDAYVDGGRALVAELDGAGAAECLVLSMPGTLRYLEAEVPLACITGVTTSRIARGQGLATRLTARCVAEDAADGACVSLLGMFEQGFYNRLGFGTGSYVRQLRFDPADLTIERRARPPRRLSRDDAEALQAARLRTRHGHGAVTVTPVAHLLEEDLQDGWGYGYEEGGELTHGLWLQAEHPEHGPYRVRFLFYRHGDDLLELLAFLRGLSDQVQAVVMREPPGIQLQDLLRTPERRRRTGRGSAFGTECTSAAWWQLRINDLAGCLARTHLPGHPLRFNLVLTDPLADYLPEDQPWRGVAGQYRVILANESTVWDGQEEHWRTLTCSVGAFTRLWLGVRSASSLAITDDLSGPPELLARLDERLRLPEPCPDWKF